MTPASPNSNKVAPLIADPPPCNSTTLSKKRSVSIFSPVASNCLKFLLTCLKSSWTPLKLSQSVSNFNLSWVPLQLSQIVLSSSWGVLNCLEFLSNCLELSWVLLELSWIVSSSSWVVLHCLVFLLSCLELSWVSLELTWIFSGVCNQWGYFITVWACRRHKHSWRKVLLTKQACCAGCRRRPFPKQLHK